MEKGSVASPIFVLRPLREPNRRLGWRLRDIHFAAFVARMNCVVWVLPGSKSGEVRKVGETGSRTPLATLSALPSSHGERRVQPAVRGEPPENGPSSSANFNLPPKFSY